MPPSQAVCSLWSMYELPVSGCSRIVSPSRLSIQPRQKRGEFRSRKGNLIHRAKMRPDQFVVPTSDLRLGKFSRNPLAQSSGAAARLRRVVIDVRMVMLDRRRIP